MKLTVFHIFFWVLVVWAGPSYGKAYEIESIIFNNTQQPYKDNLHNGMMPLVSFQYLVMLWRGSNDNGQGLCNQQRVPTNEYFFVHGLWPQLRNGRRIDCSKTNWHTPYNRGQLSPKLVSKMNIYWPNLNGVGYIDSRQHEYEKHGSCFFPTRVQYFESAMGMMDQIHSKLQYYGIARHCFYSLNELRYRFLLATGVYPKLQCRGSYLNQVFFCVTKSNRLFNCTTANAIDYECKAGGIRLW